MTNQLNRLNHSLRSAISKAVPIYATSMDLEVTDVDIQETHTLTRSGGVRFYEVDFYLTLNSIQHIATYNHKTPSEFDHGLYKEQSGDVLESEANSKEAQTIVSELATVSSNLLQKWLAEKLAA